MREVDDSTLAQVLGISSSDAQAPPASKRLVPGGSFALDDAEIQALWGRGDEVLWSQGEPLLIVGPTGVGHTTTIQRLLLARLGIRSPEILGFPVQPDDRPILYIAADRPRQAMRSFRRMVGEDDRADLDARLFVWKGPPEFDIAREPERLANWATGLGVGTVVIDALKDVAARLSEDETGAAVSRAFNLLVADEIEVVAAHHGRKATGENRKPNTLADVYGSVWITAGTGSVVLLWGRAGDPVIELTHLKQPAGEVGPLQVVIDHASGEVEVMEGTDHLAILRAAAQGLSAKEAARAFFGSSEPTKSEEMRARRKLERFVARGLAYRRVTEERRGAVKGADRYFATPPSGIQESL